MFSIGFYLKTINYNGRVGSLRKVLEDGTLPLNEKLYIACVKLLRSLTHLRLSLFFDVAVLSYHI